MPKTPPSPAIKGAKRTRLPPSVRQEQILSAALAEFVEHGFESTSVARIAQRAGTAKGNVYVHFPSKEAMFETLLQQMLGRAGTDWVSLFGDVADSTEFVDRFLEHAYSGMTRDAVAVMKLMITEIHRVPALGKRWNESLLADRDARLRVVQSLVQRGVIKEGPLTRCFHLAAAPLVFMAVMQMVMPVDSPLVEPDELRQAHRELLLANLGP